MDTVNKNKSIYASLVISLIIVFFILLLWDIAISFVLHTQNYQPESLQIQWWQVLIFLAYAALLGYLAEKFSVKFLLKYLISFIVFWGFVSVISVHYFSTNLFFMRVAGVTMLTVFVIHLKKIWTIDSQLTDKLVELASESHFLEGNSTEARIESSLKMLESIFPLSEAIVFRLDKIEGLKPVGRARSGGDDSLLERQSAWREGIALCEKALETNQTTIQTDETNGNSAQIALPLIYQEIAVGVLFVKIHQNFDLSDQYLLESLCGQLARNFQRKQLREKDLTNKFWWSFLSTSSAENRIETTSLIRSLMKEQAFSAIASSYLKEAHAIAYLDGTLAYLNRQMRHLAQFRFRQDRRTRLFRFARTFQNRPVQRAVAGDQARSANRR